MALKDKLKKYFNETGIQRKWFAEKLGMNPYQFYHMASGYSPLPKKYWPTIIELTDGEVTLGDLLEQNMEGIDFLQITQGRKAGKCVISLKKINKTP
jgi:hypothetical protein